MDIVGETRLLKSVLANEETKSIPFFIRSQSLRVSTLCSESSALSLGFFKDETVAIEALEKTALNQIMVQGKLTSCAFVSPNLHGGYPYHGKLCERATRRIW
jgi:hypothetical protein